MVRNAFKLTLMPLHSERPAGLIVGDHFDATIAAGVAAAKRFFTCRFISSRACSVAVDGGGQSPQIIENRNGR
jgi:hypothetical protein